VPTQIVIVARPSAELRLALDALDDLSDRVRHFSRPSKSIEKLLSSFGASTRHSIGAVLVEIGDPDTDVAEFVAGLRRDPATALIPIVLFGPSDAYRRLVWQNGSRANSFVQTGSDPVVTTMMLTRTIHYWTVVNRAAEPSPAPSDNGSRA